MYLYSGNRGNPLYDNLESRMGWRLFPLNPFVLHKALLALHTELASQSGTHFFTTTPRATLPDPNTINPALLCDMFEPDPKHRNAMLRSELAPEWIKSEHVEMDGLFKQRQALKRVLRSRLTCQLVFSAHAFTTKSVTIST